MENKETLKNINALIKNHSEELERASKAFTSIGKGMRKFTEAITDVKLKTMNLPRVCKN